MNQPCSNVIVSKSNAMIDKASYSLSTTEQRLILACMAKIDSRKLLSEAQEFTITAKEYSTMFHTPLNHTYGQIKSASEDLFQKEIKIFLPDDASEEDPNNSKKKKSSKKKYLTTRWLSDVTYDENGGKVILNFAPKVIPFISDLKDNFTSYDVMSISYFKSTYSIRLYELCKQYLRIGERVIDVDVLRNLLELEDQYSDFRDFNKRVLKIAATEINKFADIEVEIIPIRESRKVAKLKFVIKSKAIVLPPAKKGTKIPKKTASSKTNKNNSKEDSLLQETGKLKTNDLAHWASSLAEDLF